jgi:hypothetical protein
MTGPTFAELSARPPWSWGGSYVHTGQGWFNGPCPSQAIHDCRPPWLDAPVPEVPEPATSLLLAFGLAAVYMWKLRVTDQPRSSR